MRPFLSTRDLAKIVRPGRIACGHGLYLQITKNGGRSWILRYREGDRAVHMGLGSCDYVTLAQAREKAIAAQRMRLDGVDPLAAKRAAKRQRLLASVHASTFREIAEAYTAMRESSWRGDHSRVQWQQSLEKYAYPRIGGVAIADIDLAAVLATLEPIWVRLPETGRRLRSRIELIIDHAAARGLRPSKENPARWKLLKSLLPDQRKATTVKHLPAMKYTDVPAFMQELRKQDGIAARALEFQVLAAARPGEACGARWREIDRDVWTIPAERTKAHREHRIPLCRRAVELLAALPRVDDGEFVFPAARGGPLLQRELQRVLKRMERDDAVPHGFRSAFSDWAHERTATPTHVIEMALSHAVGNAVERAYRRTDLFEQRRRLMQQWADYCDRPSVGGDVVPMRAS